MTCLTIESNGGRVWKSYSNNKCCKPMSDDDNVVYKQSFFMILDGIYLMCTLNIQLEYDVSPFNVAVKFIKSTTLTETTYNETTFPLSTKKQ